MYYLDEIMNRTFETWSKMLGANDQTFWNLSSTVETKPTSEPDTKMQPSTPEETPAWEPADETVTESYQETSSQETSNQDASSQVTPMGETVEQIAEAAKEVFNELNPFTDEEQL
jgi:hypothetical protein|tara:strand:+ start:439 stop:783 length:345 start_codon:yes stop_codon:yes gene_type:complete